MIYFQIYFAIGFTLALRDYYVNSQLRKEGYEFDPLTVTLAALILALPMPFLLLWRKLSK